MTLLRGIPFADAMQFFPVQQTLVGKHLHKAVETPIIVHHAVAYLPLAFLFGGLVLLLFHDHLPLGKIANDHSPFSQCASDEMRCFVQTVLLFVALVFGYSLVHLRETDVAAGFLFTAIPLRSNFVQLSVVPAVALEPADVVKTPLISDAHGQCLDAQVKGYRTLVTHWMLLALFALVLFGVLVLLRIIVHERTVVVPSCISGHGHFPKVFRWGFSQMGCDVGVPFGCISPTAPCGQDDRVALHFQVHRRIAQGEELMSWFHSRKAWFLLAFCHATKESLHPLVETEVHFR